MPGRTMAKRQLDQNTLRSSDGAEFLWKGSVASAVALRLCSRGGSLSVATLETPVRRRVLARQYGSDGGGFLLGIIGRAFCRSRNSK